MNTTQFTSKTDSRIIKAEGTVVTCRSVRAAYDLSREALAWGATKLTFVAPNSPEAFWS